MSQKRKRIPLNTAAMVAYKSDNKCCVCQNGEKGVHIHHVDGDSDNNNINNLAYLCFPHHDDASKIGSLSRKLSPQTVKLYRDKWYEEVAEIRQKRREMPITPINGISEEHLIKAALSANVIMELIKIKEKYFNADWDKRETILSNLDCYSDYSNFRISYEIFLFLSRISSYLTETPSSIIGIIYSSTQVFYPSPEEDKEQIVANQVISMANNIIYEATIYQENLNMATYGCQILKTVYQLSLDEGKKDVREAVQRTYQVLRGTFEIRQKDYSKFLTLIKIFKDDLDNWGASLPLLPPSLWEEITKERNAHIH